DDIKTWRGDKSELQQQAEMRLHTCGFDIWAVRLRRSYRLGIVALLLGVTILLVPHGHIGATRWLAIALAALGCMVEVAWIAAQWILVGSPVSVYNDTPDVPKSGTRALWVRSAKPLRNFARLFVPLVRIRV